MAIDSQQNLNASQRVDAFVGRDRYMDLLRVAAIGSVVFGHWLMAVVALNSQGDLTATNALIYLPHAQILTWVLQVMPLFFFVGGFVHALALQSVTKRGGDYGDFLRVRVIRFLEPTLIFLIIWLLLAMLLRIISRDSEVASVVTGKVVQPLWFIGIYLMLMALTPLMLRLHWRYGLVVPLILGLGAVFVDILRFLGGIEEVAGANIVIVWAAVHQLGFAYADGSLLTHRYLATAMMFAGLFGMIILTFITGWYPVSMVGLPGETVSNMSPPTLALVAEIIWLIGIALLLRNLITNWLQHKRVWAVVVATNTVAMTTFLWHLSALFLFYWFLMWLRIPLPSVGSGVWWLTRPVWLTLLAVVCSGIVFLFRRWEAPISIPLYQTGAAVPGVATALVCYGIAAVALAGFDEVLTGSTSRFGALPISAIAGFVVIIAGWVLLRWWGKPHKLQTPTIN